MKRLLTSLLLVSLLTATMAWASDVHVTATPDESNRLVVLDEGLSAADALMPCHYCGCGTAHVLALPSTVAQPAQGKSPAQRPPYRYSIVSHLPDPIGKPPRA